MAPVKSLKELMVEADSLLLAKQASAATPSASQALAGAVDSSISEMTSLLDSAAAPVEVQMDAPAPQPTAEMDKVAEALCRVEVASAIDSMARMTQFSKEAQAAGYNLEQVEDAILKVAAEKKTKHIPLLVTMGYLRDGFGHGVKNVLPEKPKTKAYTRMLGDYDLTKSVGY